MQHTQLCRLIDESLRPFTDQFAFCLTKETEKNLLIVLSQGMVVKVLVCNNKCSVGSHCDDHNCLTKIIGDLSLKQDIDDQLLKVYLNSISYCLASVPWDSMDEVHVGRNGDALRKSSEDAFHTKAVELESSIVFRGTLVQLFCSLLNQSGWMEAAGGALNKHPMLLQPTSEAVSEICNCKIRNCCSPQMLMLMHEYFEDLLMQPMTQLESDQEDILEGSPFLVSVSDARIHNVTSRHLQRLAVFLFLRCSFSLVGLRDKTADQCGCANLKSCLKSDSSSDLECYSRKKGLSELYGCLQGHLPAEMFIGCKFYSERCTSFSLSFLRLFIHEDDILFEVLLQLFHVSFGGKQQVCQDRCDDMLFHLHHDHQVLLDYLISKDTGAKAAEYLLSSPCVLYVIRGTHLWNFQQKGKLQMKRKVLVDDSLIEGHLTSSSMKSKGIRLSLGKQCQKDLMRGSKHCRTTRLPFGNAKDCLLSLKKSLQNLHKKSLFPYNPQVFLMVAQNSFGGCGSPELKCRRRWRRKRGTLSLFTRLQSFLRLGGQKVTDLDFTFFAYRSKWLDKSPHSWILYGVDGVHGVSPSDDKMILVGLSIVISHLLLWSGSLPQRSAVVCHCSYAGF
ncbi:unnamed protein product [Camellia sinensis]